MLFRIKKHRTSKYMYALSRSEALAVRFGGLIGLFSLIPLSVGFYIFSTQSIIVTILSAPFYIIAILYLLMTFLLMAIYRSFDINSHKDKIKSFYISNKKLPAVAVLLPVSGESEDVIKKTAKAALNMSYSNFKVHLLDDSKDGIYKKMAKDLGLIYLHRKDTGVEKKAGNLNAALSKIHGFKYALVLDADFVPRKEMITELIPYADSDVAIVQSPQHFDLNWKVFKRSKIEYGAGLIQQNFYRITQPGRNRFGAAMCVGTNALYDIAALKKVGGFEGVGRKEWAHSEDVHTGLKLIHATNESGKRYRIEYLPIQLAKGVCPEDHHSFYKQQNRWATGSFQLILSNKTLFSKKLSLPQKLFYSVGPLYYFYTIGYLFTPLQLLIVLLLSTNNNVYNSFFLFLPSIITSVILIPFILRQRYEPLSTNLVVLSNAYTFLQALLLLVIQKPLGWEASGAKSKKKSSHFTYFKVLSSLIFILIYLATLGVLLINGIPANTGLSLLVVLFGVSFAAHIVYLYYTYIGSTARHRLHISPGAYVYASVILLTATVGFTSSTNSSYYDIELSEKSIVSLQPDKSTKKISNISTTKSISQPAQISKIDQIQETAQDGDSQSSIATRIAQRIGGVYQISDAQAGKLQDAIMRDMGYSNQISAGITYTFSNEKIMSLLKISYVFDDEVNFWQEYSHIAAIR